MFAVYVPAFYFRLHQFKTLSERKKRTTIGSRLRSRSRSTSECKNSRFALCRVGLGASRLQNRRQLSLSGHTATWTTDASASASTPAAAVVDSYLSGSAPVIMVTHVMMMVMVI